MGMNRGAKIVSDKLIFCVDAASKRSYDGGTAWNDLSALGSSQEGELVNGPTFSDLNGGYINLDGPFLIKWGPPPLV